jgi:hypothetical protein
VIRGVAGPSFWLASAFTLWGVTVFWAVASRYRRAVGAPGIRILLAGERLRPWLTADVVGTGLCPFGPFGALVAVVA